MLVLPASADDLPAIRSAFAHGAAIQRRNATSAWPDFDDAFFLREIDAGLLQRVMEGDAIAGVFSVAYADAAIWGDLERGAHIYLHRITRSPEWTGSPIFDHVLAWAVDRCRTLRREGLRMDTWASNTKLVAYYTAKGFELVGVRRMPADARLAAHYHGIELALLEMEI